MDEVTARDPRYQFWVQCSKPELEGKYGTTFTLSNGLLGLRGAHEECPSWGRPEFYVAGTYAGGPASLLGFHDPDHILTHPDRITPEALKSISETAIWTLPNLPWPIGVRLSVGGVPFSYDTSRILSNERLLEIDKALVRRCMVFRDAQGRRTRVDSLRFVSMQDRNLICLRYRVTPLAQEAEVRVEGFIKTDVTSPNGLTLWRLQRSVDRPALKGVECLTNESGLTVSIAQMAVVRAEDGSTVLDLFAVAGEMPLESAVAHATAAAAMGLPACMRRHVAAYRGEVEGAQIEFDEDPSLVQGFNFGQMHLHMALSPIADRVGCPIKGLTGSGYRFANFWDLDFHMYPYFLLTKPDRAHMFLEYRYNQLDAYRENARIWGAEGAQVPWETNTRGVEETAPWLCLQDREIHISADAAYMFKLYDDLTPNHDVMVNMGAEFIFETARFYASRVRWVAERERYELPDVGCPDQYHTFVDNSVFISLWARWNLEYAAALSARPELQPAAAKVGLRAEEVERWTDIVRKLYIIGPRADGVIEEFDGFFDLDTDLNGICETYCRHSQAVKQPDVLAAFGPFEHLYPEEIRRANWRFYNARTLHGSSLSFPGMALAAARCGLNDEALYHLGKSTRMDLDDVNLDTERGVHVSGGAVEWQAIVLGFGGLTPMKEYLHFRPNLPRRWSRLSFTVHWQLQPVRVRLTRGEISFEAGTARDTPVMVRLGDALPFAVAPGTQRIMKWKDRQE